MDDLDRLLAETMRDAAGDAPSDNGLLGSVHRRSGRYRRQRAATALSAVVAALAVAIPTVAVLVTRTPEIALAPAAVPDVRLVAGYTPPAFPYTLPATSGVRAPVASMKSGTVSAFFEATELRQHADTTVTVSSREPAFTGAATEKPASVRGRPGTMRTVDVKPAKQLTLYWQEAPNRWIQVATDDTYTPRQVVALADALVPASVPVLPPFDLDLSPAGWTTDTVTASAMTFRTAGADLTVVLRERRPLSGTNRTVGPYRASLTRTAHRVTVDVDVTDWNATLHVSASAFGEEDLLRFAAGVHILNRSDPE